jgi:hypothetical protein
MRYDRLKYFAAMLMIGDGVVAMLQPQRDAETWRGGPKFWNATMSFLAAHPEITRAVGAAEAAIGLALIAGDQMPAQPVPNESAEARSKVSSIAV